jgi:hypothetical protein
MLEDGDNNKDELSNNLFGYSWSVCASISVSDQRQKKQSKSFSCFSDNSSGTIQSVYSEISRDQYEARLMEQLSKPLRKSYSRGHIIHTPSFPIDIRPPTGDSPIISRTGFSSKLSKNSMRSSHSKIVPNYLDKKYSYSRPASRKVFFFYDQFFFFLSIFHFLLLTVDTC